MRQNAVSKKKRAFENLIGVTVLTVIGTGLMGAFFLCQKSIETQSNEPVKVIQIQEPEPKEVTQVVPTPTEKIELFITLPVDMDVETQEQINSICKEQCIDFQFVMAVIWRESRFNAGAMGDNETSYGLMQIKPKWHQERMEELQVTNLLNPVSNAKVGINILIELFEKYEDPEMVLMAYNMGESAAKKLWQQGIYKTSYSQDVLEKAQEYTDYIE